MSVQLQAQTSPKITPSFSAAAGESTRTPASSSSLARLGADQFERTSGRGAAMKALGLDTGSSAMTPPPGAMFMMRRDPDESYGSAVNESTVDGMHTGQVLGGIAGGVAGATGGAMAGGAIGGAIAALTGAIAGAEIGAAVGVWAGPIGVLVGVAAGIVGGAIAGTLSGGAAGAAAGAAEGRVEHDGLTGSPSNPTGTAGGSSSKKALKTMLPENDR